MKTTDKILQQLKQEFPHRNFHKNNCEQDEHHSLLLEVYDTKDFFQTKHICLVYKKVFLSKKSPPLNEDDIEIYPDTNDEEF